jgi:hypothetical protein
MTSKVTPGPNLWALTRGMGLIPPSCLVVVRRFTRSSWALIFSGGGPVERLTTSKKLTLCPLPFLPSFSGASQKMLKRSSSEIPVIQASLAYCFSPRLYPELFLSA